MNCNCNNNETSGEQVKIKHVNGNVLRLAIPLTLRTIEKVDEEIVATDTSFSPSSDSPVNVVFSKGAAKTCLTATMDGNIAYVEDNGTIPVGTYAITVMCKDDNGNPYRFKQNTVLQVVDATADAGIEQTIEYEVTTWYLDAAIFMALKGEDGVGVEDIQIQQSGEIGGENIVTFILTDGRTESFSVLNGSGSVDFILDAGSSHPVANSVITSQLNNVNARLAELFGDVEYDSKNKVIRFLSKGDSKGSGSLLATLDAKPFIKDAMVSNVYLSNGTLIVTFNTDSGRDPINVPLSSIFNPNNYYTKTQVDSKVAQAIAGIDTSGLMSRAEFVNENTNRLKYSSIPPVVLNYIENVSMYEQQYSSLFGTSDGHIKGYSGPTMSDLSDYGSADGFIFVDKTSDLSYRWTGSAWQQVGGSGGGSIEQVQADWSETDTTDPAYIKNKPTIPDVSGLATTDDVDAAVAALVSSAPATLDTLKELADALGDDPNFATTISTALGNKVDKEAGKGLSTNDYTTAEKSKLANLADVATSGSYDDLTDKPTIPAAQVNADWNAASGVAQVLNKPTIPTKVSDLTNDEGYVTAEDVAGVVAATGDVVVVESNDYIDIFIYGAEVNITPSVLALYASQKSATIKVSGSHLKSDIAISVPSGFTASPSTIAHVNGVVAETDVTITYTGADASTASGDITATAGDATKTIPVAYTQYSGPTIIADDTAISFKAGGGATQQQTLTVQGVNLTEGIAAAISGTNASKFSVSPASISQSGGAASGTLTITYSPAAADSGTHTATLTLSSSGATSKTITLNGAVSEITTSVDSLTMTAQKNSSATETFTVEGSNLAGNLSIVASGTGLSVDQQTIVATDGVVAETTVTVTFSPTATGTVNGTITITDGNISKSISVEATATGRTIYYNDYSKQDSWIEWETGVINTSTGEEEENTDRCRTVEFLPCSGTIAFTRQSGNINFVFYNENKAFISNVYKYTTSTFDVPANAKYFRANLSNKNLSSVAVLDSTTGKYWTKSGSMGGIYATNEP